jgi:hypothetical protein
MEHHSDNLQRIGQKGDVKGILLTMDGTPFQTRTKNRTER